MTADEALRLVRLHDEQLDRIAVLVEQQRAYPLTLALPNGVRAQLIIGSAEAGQPRYEVAGESIEVDVRIPVDLADRWFWWGSFLAVRVESGVPPICIDPGTYPPPGWPAVRGSCFDAARRIEAMSAAITSAPTKRQASRTKPLPEREFEAVQLGMEL